MSIESSANAPNPEARASSGGSKEAAAEPNPYLVPTDLPTNDAGEGIYFDFNWGARVLLPPKPDGRWRATLTDLDNSTIIYQGELEEGHLSSTKKFYIRFAIDVQRIASDGTETQVLHHEFDARDKIVLVQLPVGTLGDTLGWFPYVARFAEQSGARVICCLAGVFIPLFAKAYPEIELTTKEDLEESPLRSQIYATYHVGLFFDDTDNINQPCDFRYVGLHRTAGYILGVDPTESAPKIVLEDDTRPIEEPYVCIATQASSQCKYWNNPGGWLGVIAFLKKRGYRVICIDQKPYSGTGIVWNQIPHGAEDQTGNRPLTERARWLKHADLFVGLSSGLSWLAWAAGTKTVMISGFTHPNNEFQTPWRIISWHACNSCWNDPRHMFDHNDFLWCPRHANTERQFECSKLISTDVVTKNIADALEA
ncbi:autotransporter strand-loop-strand O-heptosyltransferase [Asaia astilbis]|uniref:autotransporter strand-loop-strand O-heptosyltransferase n=1 Tax=Asaia astilbis TaxID=610244 RepID=UPI00046FB060|nr:autotransporter strand-loop-strand O-heptosyltransferase [Asaia astilbis]